MCPPEHFGVLYEINPWMHREVTVDLDLARDAVGRAGGHPRGGRRRGRAARAAARAARPGVHRQRRHREPRPLRAQPLPPSPPPARGRPRRRLVRGPRLRGAAAPGGRRPRGRRRRPALPGRLPLRLPVALRCRRPRPAVDACSARRSGPSSWSTPASTTSTSRSAPSTTGGPWSPPTRWDSYGRKVVEALVPEPLVLEDDEMLAFCANSVVVGRTVVMAAVPAPARTPAGGVGLRRGGADVERVPQGRRRLPLPHVGLRCGHSSNGHTPTIDGNVGGSLNPKPVGGSMRPQPAEVGPVHRRPAGHHPTDRHRPVPLPHPVGLTP